MDAQQLVPVSTVSNPVEAEMIRGALNAEGIACQLSGENQASLVGILEITILTHAADADRARKLIAEHDRRHRKH